jgi:hypothetical protein
MHKIDSNGATITNEFTEGSVVLSIPATVVSADWANAVQKELVTIIEGAGLVLKTSGTETGDQLLAAVQALIAGGGSVLSLSQAINNNQASAADVTAFPQFDTTDVVGLEFLYRTLRRTDSSYVLEMGRAYLIWDSEASAWVVSRNFQNQDANVEFTVALVSGTNYKLRYTSDNLAGASYAGSLRITDIKKILI